MGEVIHHAGRQKPERHEEWFQTALPCTFPDDRVDVWKFYLDETTPADSNLGVLSSDEIARAARFHFEKDRTHYTRCRTVLRDVLAGYLAIPADEIRFEYAPSGKPHLASEQNPRALQFNVSHSGGMALIAVGSVHRIGVDIEKIRAEADTTSLAERFFSSRECVGLRALPDHLRVLGFFACWTRKEAFLKATGDGLSFPLADFSVTTHPDLDPRLEEIKGSEDAREKWFLSDFNVADGFRAALACEGGFTRVELLCR
jgi:4'-phosphopantetheinyl transferase